MLPDELSLMIGRIDERSSTMAETLTDIKRRVDQLPCATRATQIALLESDVKRKSGIIAAITSGVVLAGGFVVKSLWGR